MERWLFPISRVPMKTFAKFVGFQHSIVFLFGVLPLTAFFRVHAIVVTIGTIKMAVRDFNVT